MGTTPLARTDLSIAAWLNGACDALFYALIFTTIFVLSGAIYGVNFYLPLCVVMLLLTAHSFFRRRQASLPSLALMLCILASLVVWVMLGLFNGFDIVEIKVQLSEVLLTFFTCWYIHVFIDRQPVRQIRFLRWVLLSVLASALLKIGVLVYAVTQGIPVVQIVVLLDRIFGGDIMTMELGDLLGRVQFGADALIPVCIFVILQQRDRLRTGSLQASVAILVLLVSVLFSFSRYYWAFTALAFVLGLVLGKRDRFLAILATIVGLTVLVSLPSLITLYQLRFSDAVAGGSDAERTEQLSALHQFFWDSPWIGHGLGSFTTRLVRANSVGGHHNYELQLLALSGQIGILGMLALSALLLWYFRPLWLPGSLKGRDRVGIALLLGAWVAGGTANPLLFNPISGIIFTTLHILTKLEPGVASNFVRDEQGEALPGKKMATS